ncbi:MAG: glycoside hydrolase family 15 protein, partial [Alicyclobacillus sp.]|nr:glycoside hydrolase family 15 protein [Alicyclobacillus sp.]
YIACPNFAQYRYCWLRDGTFTAYAMDRVGQHESARRFYHWVHATLRRQGHLVERVAEVLKKGLAPEAADVPPTRYRLDGSPAGDDWGNFQLDGYGAWLWGLAQHVRLTGETGLLREFEESIDLTLRYLTLCWNLPNYDCWEEAGDRRHPATLAAIYGGLRAINEFLRRDELEALAVTIADYVLTHGVVDGRFAKSMGNTSIDASLLWLAIPFGLVAPADARMVKTVAEIEKRLHHQGVHRYPEDTYYGGGEWPLLACWLGWYYCRAGRPEAARPLLAWVEGCANAEGELPEQMSTHLNAPSWLPVWRARWGEVATPLLWSHAMYLVLREEMATLGL